MPSIKSHPELNELNRIHMQAYFQKTHKAGRNHYLNPLNNSYIFLKHLLQSIPDFTDEKW
jgi:hypothetical protein